MPSPLRIPQAPLSDAEWHALQPYLPALAASGRSCDHRSRLDAIFRLAATDGPWRELPAEYGRPDTVSRYFRRLTHDGLWERLLTALAAAPEGHPLRRIQGLICRACRRAIRIRGLALIVLARRLNLRRALPGPSWMCPDPDLSEIVFRMPLPWRIPPTRRLRLAAIDYLRTLRRLLHVVAGRRYIPRALKACWP